MIVYIQWSKANPEGWEQFDITTNGQVRRLARKAEPDGNSPLDNDPGWVSAINIQGVTACGWDHIGLEVFGEQLVLSCWNDDPDDWPVGNRWGSVWTFLDPAPDHSLPGHLKGAMNTRQTFMLYADKGGPVDLHEQGIALPFDQFPYPDPRNVFHGIWLTDDHWHAHQARQAPHGWREWIR